MQQSGIAWVDLVYMLGVRGLEGLAKLLGIGFADLSVYTFALGWPLSLTAAMLLVWWYRRRCRLLQAELEDAGAHPVAARRDESWSSPLVELERASREPARVAEPALVVETRDAEIVAGDFLRVPRREDHRAPSAEVNVRPLAPRELRRRGTAVDEVLPDNDDGPSLRRKGVANDGRRAAPLHEPPGVERPQEPGERLRLDVRLQRSDRL